MLFREAERTANPVQTSAIIGERNGLRRAGATTVLASPGNFNSASGAI
jgi:hypothetical protein